MTRPLRSGKTYVLPREVFIAGNGVSETLALHKLERNAIRQAQMPQPSLTAASRAQSMESPIYKLDLTQWQQHVQKILHDRPA
jgi:hypothetical protein